MGPDVIKILLARRYVTGQVVAEAHLDDSQFLEDGVTPNPAWVLRHEWLINPEEWANRTPAQRDAWIQSMRQEFQAECKAQLTIVADREAGGTVLPIEGSTFNP